MLVIAVDCGPPTSVSHGSVDVSSGTLFNSLVVYSCDTGYRLAGNSRQLCGSEGMWLPKAPTCYSKSHDLTPSTQLVLKCY